VRGQRALAGRCQVHRGDHRSVERILREWVGSGCWWRICGHQRAISSRLNLHETNRSLNRRHRKLTGASTLTRRKNGRRSSVSTALSSHISVVTQRSLHLSVTKSSNSSTLANVWLASRGLAVEGRLAFEADFSTAGVVAVRARYMRLN